MWTLAAYSRDPLTPLEDLMRFAIDAGLTCVQLSWEQVVRAASTGSRTLEVGVQLRRAGLGLVGIDAAVFDCMDAEAFERQTDDTYLQMRAAHDLGAPQVSLSAGPRDPANFMHLRDGVSRLTALAERLGEDCGAGPTGTGADPPSAFTPCGVQLAIRNVCGSSVEQLSDLHKLFRSVGGASLALELDMREFQAAVVNPYDAALSFAPRTTRVRICDVNLKQTLAVLEEEGFAGPILVATEDELAAARRT